MPTSVVFGASGAVGRFLVPQLLERGNEVIAVSRENRDSSREGLRWLAGDLYGDLPQLPQVDAIYSVGPLDGFATWLERANLAGQPRIVALGSLSVLSKRDSPDAAERALAERLAGAEAQLVAAAESRGCAWTVLRPTLIYGAGLDRSLSPIARFGARWRVFPRLAGARGLRQPVHAEDLADLCLLALDTPVASGRRYEAGGGERLAFADMLERVRASLPVATLPLPVPLSSLRRLINSAPRWRHLRAPASRLGMDLIADNGKTHAELGWSPRPFRPTADCWKIPPLP